MCGGRLGKGRRSFEHDRRNSSTRSKHVSAQDMRKLRLLRGSLGSRQFTQKVFITRKGANINTRDPKSDRTPLMLACKSGYLALVRALLNEGAEINAQDKDGVTAFGHAITSEKGENIGLIELLLEKDVDVTRGKFEWNVEDPDRRRPRPDKKIKGFSGIKENMGSYSEIHKKRRIYGKSGRSVRAEGRVSKREVCGFESDPVGIAIRRKFEVVAIRLLKMLGNCHKRDPFSGNSYLHLAVFHQNWKVVAFLVEKGLNPDERNNHDKTVWFFCQDEDAQNELKSYVEKKTREPNFKKKKPKKHKKKRKKKRPKLIEKETLPPTSTQPKPKQNSISIEQTSSQNASSKGGFLLSQLSVEQNSQSNKLLNDISVNGSSNKTKTEHKLLSTLSSDSKLDLKNNLSTDRSTQDLNSVYAQKKELKNECRKLEDKLNKLKAENDFINAEDSKKKSFSLLLERRFSEHNKPNAEDSLMLENMTSNNELALPFSKFAEPNASAGKLLDIISNQSVTSGLQEQTKREQSFKDEERLKTRRGCWGCLQLLAQLPMAGEAGKFESRLGRELLELEDEISVLNSLIRCKYERIQMEIGEMVKMVHKGPFELKVYGSFANGLNIPGSDLDLLLIFNNSPKKSRKLNNDLPNSNETSLGSKHRLSEDLSLRSPGNPLRKYTDPYQSGMTQQDFQHKLMMESVMEDLGDLAESMTTQFSESKYLRNAQIPVLKLVTCADSGGFPVDVTAKDVRHQGLECVDLVKRLVRKYPPLKPIVLVLKQLLTLSELSDPYMGGLSSYGLVIMIVGYFQTIEYCEAQKQAKEAPMERESRRARNWGEDARLSHRRGSRRTSRKNSFNKNVKIQKGNIKSSNLNGPLPTTNSRRTSTNRKKRAKSKTLQSKSNSVPIASIFSKSTESIGKLLLGFLYFFGFEFNMNMHQVKIFLEDEEPRPPIVQVN